MQAGELLLLVRCQRCIEFGESSGAISREVAQRRTFILRKLLNLSNWLPGLDGCQHGLAILAQHLPVGAGRFALGHEDRFRLLLLLVGEIQSSGHAIEPVGAGLPAMRAGILIRHQATSGQNGCNNGN
jgi:hypothetical protein